MRLGALPVAGFADVLDPLRRDALGHRIRPHDETAAVLHDHSSVY